MPGFNILTGKGIYNFSKYPLKEAHQKQTDGRPFVGNFSGTIPADTVLAAGDVIVCSAQITPRMALFDGRYNVGKTLGTGPKGRLAILKYPDPAATSAARAAAADKSVLHWLESERTLQDDFIHEVDGEKTITTTVNAAVAVAEGANTESVPILGYPVLEQWYLGLVITAAHGANQKVAAATDFHCFYHVAQQTQSGT